MAHSGSGGEYHLKTPQAFQYPRPPLEVRRSMRARRRALPPRKREQLSRKLIHSLVRSPLLHRAQRIAAYFPNDGEVDLSALFPILRARGRRIYLPTLMRSRLCFLPCTAETPLLLNRYGIPEPSVSARHKIAPQALDLVLLPLVAFDSEGNRLGMGGGYYDRSFAFLRQREYWLKPTLIGVAYDFQQVKKLAAQPWDIPLDGVITESGLQWFSR